MFVLSILHLFRCLIVWVLTWMRYLRRRGSQRKHSNNAACSNSDFLYRFDAVNSYFGGVCWYERGKRKRNGLKNEGSSYLFLY
jgi:hypothetical protein